MLRPFEEVTIRLSSEKSVNASEIIIFTNGLKNICEKLKSQNLDQSSAKTLDKLYKGVIERFANVEYSKTIFLCTLLDPDIKHLDLKTLKLQNQQKKHLIELVTAAVRHTERKQQQEQVSAENNKNLSFP
jgi:hypothetical protein